MILGIHSVKFPLKIRNDISFSGSPHFLVFLDDLASFNELNPKQKQSLKKVYLDVYISAFFNLGT